jgi:bla regulator protein blaR1
MMSILLYPVKLILATGLLYGYYRLFLRNRQFHRYNRFYLLSAVSIALIIPFIKIPLYLQPPTGGAINIAGTLQALSLTGVGEPDTNGKLVQGWGHWLTLYNGAGLLYAAGVVIGSFALLRSVAYLVRLRKRYPFTLIDKIRFYETTEPGSPFSFFRLVFWNRDIPLHSKEGQQIFRHELFHAKEGHSLDNLGMEFVCCLGWFNPFFHLIKKELKAIHEFLADDYAISNNDRLDYAELLVTHAIRQVNTGISHPFSQHEIKRRIMMLTKSNPLRRNAGYASRIMALPLLMILFSAFAFRWMQPANHSPLPRSGRPLTVIIDPGHGGIDPGAINDQGVREKDIVLELAQKINELAPAYNIQVVLTRNSDELPGDVSDKREGLLKRVEITNSNKADLFISLHVNNTVNNETAPATGFDAYISKRRTDDRGLMLATILLQKLSAIYSTTSAIKQRENEGVLVLDKNTCPAVLLECGYINRAADLQFITDKTNQEKIARSILEGIVQFGAKS